MKSKTRNGIILVIVVLVGIWAVGGFSHGPLSQIHLPAASVISQSNYHQVQLYNQSQNTFQNSIDTNQQTQNNYNNMQQVPYSQAGSGGGNSGYIFPTSNPNYNTVIQRIDVGISPIFMELSPLNNNVYVTDASQGAISVIDSSYQVVKTITGFSMPEQIVFNTNNDKFYISNGVTNNTIAVLNSTDQISKLIPITYNPIYLAYDSNNHKVYSTSNNGSNDTLSIIDTNDNVSTLVFNSTTGAENSILYNPNNDEIYVANSATNQIIAINPNTNTIVKIFTGNSPTLLTYNPRNHDTYFENSNNGTWSVIDSNNNIVDRFTIDIDNSGIAFNLNNNLDYITNNGNTDAVVYVLDSSHNIVKTIVIDQNVAIYNPFYNPINHNIYIVNQGTSPNNQVDVIDGNP